MSNQLAISQDNLKRITAAAVGLAMVLLIALVSRIKSTEQTVLVEEIIQEPIAVFPDFASISRVEVKKQQFFDYLQDYIVAENSRVARVRRELQSYTDIVNGGVALSVRERGRVLSLAETYRLPQELNRDIQFINELLLRVDQIPVSLVLAQAANESAWGTSRFALEGNNIFGQWCYEKGCGIVPLQRVSGASHEVQKFDSLEQAVRGYFLNINSHHSYDNFRNIRAYMRNREEALNPVILAYGLSRYSQRGDNYVDEVQTLIKQNNLRSRDQN